MKQFIASLFRHLIKAGLYTIAGGITAALVGLGLYVKGLPELKIWHEARLDAEFTADSPISTFPGYIDLEEKVFAQMKTRVLDRIDPVDQNQINRFCRGSLSDPGQWSPNWNRSFEFTAKNPKAGVVLVHGMSDSPYSLHHIGQRLHEAGFWVVGLRLPGHGTIPAGLTRLKWEDMAAALGLAVRHIGEKAGDRPLYLVGYSNGGALAVQYALSSIENRDLPKISGLVLISPSIGVARVAVLARCQAWLGQLPGLHKLSWNSIRPEYDPFKYGSFAVNAGAQVYSLTVHIQRQLNRIGETPGRLKEFPPVLAFQSAVDATVSTRALVKNLFEKFPAGNHELVLFDINRHAGIEMIRRKNTDTGLEALVKIHKRSFFVSFVTNQDKKSHGVMVRRLSPQSPIASDTALGLGWPKGIYSLSHVALPFPEEDPLYGPSGKKSPGIQLGRIDPKGETGVLHIPAADLIRLRWNPFYPYLEQRFLRFIECPGNTGVSETGGV